MKIYAMEAGNLSRLLSDRSELLAYARNLHTADEMRAAREDLYKASRVYRAPTAERPLILSVDTDGIAHIPIVGELTPEADPCGAYSFGGETEYGFIRAALAEADARPDVLGIALDINSPGGYVSGVDLTAQAIASSSKPVTAFVEDMATSAAYYLASQADKIVALSPSSQIGSIGVACEEYDDREQLARDGIAHRIYTSTDAPDKRPDTATDEGRSKIIAELDALHAVFIRRVAEGRHVSEDKVNKDFGRGGILTAEAALKAGMIDEVRGSHLSRPVPPAGVASSVAAASAAASPKEEVRMDLNLDTLKAEHPKLFDAAKAQGFEDGVKAERKRREDLLGLAVNDEAKKAVEAAIASGEDFATASPKVVTAALKGTGGDNPPAIGSAAPATASGASAISAEDRAWYTKHGVSAEELKKIEANASKEE